MTCAPLLALPSFLKTFSIICNGLGNGSMGPHTEAWGKPPAGGLPFLPPGPCHQRMAEYIQLVAATALLTEGNRKLTFGGRLTMSLKIANRDTNAWLK